MMRLTPVEILVVTINAAYSVDRAKTIGSFDVGKQADITIFDAPNLDYSLLFLCDKSSDRCLQERSKASFNLPIFIWDLLVCKNQQSLLFLKPIL